MTRAIDRVHRFGQEKKVTVYRFLVRSSIERKMQRIQNRKKRVVDTSLKSGEQQGSIVEDFAAIFADDDEEEESDNDLDKSDSESSDDSDSDTEQPN